MADQMGVPQVLQCGRNVDGRVTINVLTQVVFNGQLINAPLNAFVLSEEEEKAWQAVFNGLSVARLVPTKGELLRVK